MSTWEGVDLAAFYAGRDFEAWRWMGARLSGDGADFRVLAPAAAGASVLLGTPGGETREVPMTRCLNGAFLEAHVPGAHEGDAYEYRIYLRGGGFQDHCDPYGLGMELRPAHRSVVRDLGCHEFADDAWMASRTACQDRPLSIYELHAGSWKKPGPEPDAWYTYDELADLLIPYVTELGCTHVELLPLAEHPFDGSWGYQGCAPFSATSRYGTPEQLMGLVDRLHQAGIGVILDFVPVHFATDAWALANFDGTPLYEYPNDAVGVSEWGSHNFMHSRGEVRSLLASAADLWLGAYHFDGLRLDAVSRIVYWQGDERRGVNGMGADFLRALCDGLHERHPGCMLIAEDSSGFPGVTRPTSEGGLGFDYKWDLGWMHDTLSYFQAPPEERRHAEGRLTFSMMYFPNERYLLPLSHDEVVHGKATIAQKMGAGALPLHGGASGQDARLHGQRVCPAPRVGREARAGLVSAGVPRARRLPALPLRAGHGVPRPPGALGARLPRGRLCVARLRAADAVLHRHPAAGRGRTGRRALQPGLGSARVRGAASGGCRGSVRGGGPSRHGLAALRRLHTGWGDRLPRRGRRARLPPRTALGRARTAEVRQEGTGGPSRERCA